MTGPAGVVAVSGHIGAIRNLRGRAEGPQPPEIVKRFLWFLPLSDDEARAIALRLR